MATFASSPATFLVEEIPAYQPSWFGEHTFVWIEKVSLTTLDAIDGLARRLAVPSREVGYAGMKDRHATTRQWLSLPRVAPAVAVQAGDDRLRVLLALRHGNKLRVGHLRGNRFEVTVAGLAGGAEAAALHQRLADLAAAGVPNRYGAQRFGAGGDNVERGVALLRGGPRSDGGGGGRREHRRDFRRDRLLLSAVQSAVFNEVLAARDRAGSLRRVLGGDVLQKTDSGGVFASEDPDQEQRRLDAGALVVTGPMPGSWAREPPPGSPARAIEDRAFAGLGVSREDFAARGRDLPGARRPLLAPVVLSPPTSGAAGAGPPGSGAGTTRLGFQLPAGVYATVVLEALGVTVETRSPPSA